jgi:Zn-dependent peptidase ImmA (M78 family)/transcriptional regulator with XRE-family HTH domain
MAKRLIVQVNPKVLRWAQEASGLSLAAAAKKASVKGTGLEAWEGGKESPSFSQLKKLSQVYKRPTAVFFVDDVPQSEKPPQDFRVIHESEEAQLSPKALLELRKARQRRLIALDVAGSLGEAVPEFTMRATTNDSSDKLADQIRSNLGVDETTIEQFVSEYFAFNFWKGCVEQTGVLIFQGSFNVNDDCRAVSIYEAQFPIILLNSKDSVYGRIFSLMHEFCHLLLRRGGMCDMEVAGKVDPVEVFCNAFAAACLVPKATFLKEPEIRKNREASDWPEKSIRSLSTKYRVSMEVIVRRLLTLKLISQDAYQAFRKEMQSKKPKAKPKAIVTPDVKALSANGQRFTRLILHGYDSGAITVSDVSDYLGVNLNNVRKIRSTVFGEGKE